MSRTRWQHPKVKRSGKKPQVWKANWYVYDAAGKRHHHVKTFGPTKTTERAVAQQACDELVQRETSQTPPRNADITLSTLINDVYLPTKSRWGQNTRLGIFSTIKQHIMKPLGDARLADINKAMLSKHLIAMATAGCGASLLRRVRAILHAAFEEALDNDYLERNPVRRLEIPACKPIGLMRSLTEAEVTRLFGSTSGEDRLLFRLLVLTGARISEVLALRRDHIVDGGILIDQSALFGAPGPTKTRKTRFVPIPADLQMELKHWLTLRVDDNPLVFPGHHGEIMRHTSRPYLILKRARKAAGIPDLTFHTCRRTFATLYKGDVADVQAMLGHTTSRTTLAHYKKAVPERQREAVEELNRRLQ